MTKAADALLEEALALPAEDRARLASDLLASLDDEAADQAEIDRWWSEETAWRSAQLDSGEVRAHTWEQILQLIAERRSQRMA